MSFELPTLPYDKTALEPHMSAETFDYHHGKHHNAYVTKLNALTEGSEWAGKSLDDIIGSAEGGLFNQAAQHFNHSFFWKCMKPGGGGEPTGALADAIKRDFGSLDEFSAAFSAASAGQFGSGWAWLVIRGGKLEIMTTGNADLPQKHDATPLLTLDVWEHAYYVDYRNARPKYIETFLNKLINWDFVAENLGNAS